MTCHPSVVASPVSALIATHITACAEHDRLFGLNDWGLGDEEPVQDAVDEIDRALLALCQARPTTPEDAGFRRQYLLRVLPPALTGCDGLLKKALAALIDGDEA